MTDRNSFADKKWSRRDWMKISLAVPVGLSFYGRRAAGAETERATAICPFRAVTQEPGNHFFGYYDKFPWSGNGRYLLAQEIGFMDHSPKPEEPLTLARIDTQENDKWEPFGETLAWNWQQGTMLQWLAIDPDRLVVFNNREGDRFISIIRDMKTGEERKLPRPVYAVSRSGRHAVSLNFARVARTRPGYGYAGVEDPGADDPQPENDGIWLMDLETGENKLVVSIAQAARLKPKPDMDEGDHWFNHLLFNTTDTRFIFLHRWKKSSGGWRTRMLTANPDGSDVRIVADEGMVSHFDWKDSHHILAWATHEGKNAYWLFDERTGEAEIVGSDVFDRDGHCSYSPDRKWILTDTYPDKERMQTLILYRLADGKRIDVGRFYLSRDLKGEFRCDLHPRWSRGGRKVCIDSAHTGKRQMYVLDVASIVG